MWNMHDRVHKLCLKALSRALYLTKLNNNWDVVYGYLFHMIQQQFIHLVQAHALVIKHSLQIGEPVYETTTTISKNSIMHVGNLIS